MTTYMIYDYERENFIMGFECATRKIANEWCDKLEAVKGYEKGTLAPVRFVNGFQIGKV